jgi:hypothetical protein
MLVQDLHVRVMNAATGELIRELTIDPARDYQPLGRNPGVKHLPGLHKIRGGATVMDDVFRDDEDEES